MSHVHRSAAASVATEQPESLIDALIDHMANAPPQEPLPPQEILDPTSGELIQPTDVDGLIALYGKLKERSDAIKVMQYQIREALAAMTTGETKTRRVEGAAHAGKLEWPSDEWDDAELLRLYREWPELRDRWLTIKKVGVKAVEFKKALAMNSTEPGVNEFRDAIAACKLKPKATAPTLTVER